MSRLKFWKRNGGSLDPDTDHQYNSGKKKNMFGRDSEPKFSINVGKKPNVSVPEVASDQFNTDETKPPDNMNQKGQDLMQSDQNIQDETSLQIINEEQLKNIVAEVLQDENLLIIEKILLQGNVMQTFINAILSLLEDKYELVPTKIYRENAAEAKNQLDQLNEQVQVARQQHDDIKEQTNEYIENLSQIAAEQLQLLVKNILLKGNKNA
ncbi:MAG: hypothetical protein EKK54_06035 [Neisseriaceae bacterium]|nr:MAG: hypothetical protein EKK54_06035 [Neisseriaceae bacterium]